MVRNALRIAIWHNLPNGGGNRALHDQVRGLVKRGHHVEVWCPPNADRKFLPVGDVVQEHVLSYEWRFQPWTRQFAQWLRSYHELKRHLKAMERHAQACADQINRGGFDLLLAHPCQYFFATSLARYVNCPKLIYLQEPNRFLYEAWPTLHWVAHPLQTSGDTLPRRLNRYLWELGELQANRSKAREERAGLGAYEEILVNSSFSRESVLRSFGYDSKVCYLGVDLDRFRPTAAARGPYVVGLGGIKPNKGLEVAVRSIATIETSRRPDLVWIGNNAEPSYLKQIEELASTFGVTFRPQVNIPDAQLIELVGRAATMIYTSKLEPFGYAPIEAGACGTPVVGVAEGGIRESISDGVNGILVLDNDVQQLGAAVARFTDDLEYARQVGLQARKHVEENWGLEQSIDRLERRLRDVLSRHSTPDLAPVLSNS